MNLERLIARSLSTPRDFRMKLRRRLLEYPTRPVSYLPLVEHLSGQMIRAFALGYRAHGASLRRETRDAKHAEFRRMVRDLLRQYGESTSIELRRVYDNARARGASKDAAARLALRRFGTLGHTAPVSNRLKTLYNSSMRAAHQQGIWDSTVGDASVWGYTVRTHTDDRVRPTHLQFNRITLPRDHEFWRKIGSPPWGYNCRCVLKPLKRPKKLVKPPPRLLQLEEGFRGQGFELQ